MKLKPFIHFLEYCMVLEQFYSVEYSSARTHPWSSPTPPSTATLGRLWAAEPTGPRLDDISRSHGERAAASRADVSDTPSPFFFSPLLGRWKVIKFFVNHFSWMRQQIQLIVWRVKFSNSAALKQNRKWKTGHSSGGKAARTSPHPICQLQQMSKNLPVSYLGALANPTKLKKIPIKMTFVYETEETKCFINSFHFLLFFSKIPFPPALNAWRGGEVLYRLHRSPVSLRTNIWKNCRCVWGKKMASLITLVSQRL